MLTLSLNNVPGLFKARWLVSEEKMHRGHGLRALRALQRGELLRVLLYGVHACDALAGVACGRMEGLAWAVYLRWICEHASLRIRKGRHGEFIALYRVYRVYIARCAWTS
jgi:hypothetical protein